MRLLQVVLVTLIFLLSILVDRCALMTQTRDRYTRNLELNTRQDAMQAVTQTSAEASGAKFPFKATVEGADMEGGTCFRLVGRNELSLNWDHPTNCWPGALCHSGHMTYDNLECA